jgi:Tol biopolymer transport system component
MTKLTIFLWVVLFTYSCQKNELNGGLAISEKSMPQFVLPTQITAGSESNFSPDISKDGRYLVFTSDRSVNKDLWKKDLRGGSAYKLSFHAADDFSPVLSADGKKIAFVSRRNDASGDIHIMHFGWSWKSLFNHSGENVDRVKAPNIEEQDPAWYPDGKRIIFTSRTPGSNTPQIMTANLKDLKAVPLENLYGHQPKVSPDGKQIVYVSKGNIYHFDEVSRKITALTDNDKVINGQPSFSEDGRSIYFIRYLADTNQDREINGNDVATIWKLDIPTQMNKEYKENFSMQPITNGGFSAYFPKPRGNNLYFTQENELGLDVFRLPIEGHFHSDLDLNSVVFQAKNRISIDEQIFILRAAQSKSYRLGRHSDVGELVYREMEILVDNGRWIEADWLLKKIKANLPAQTEAIQLCELSFLRLKLKEFFPRTMNEKFARYFQNLNRFLQSQYKLVIDYILNKR